METKMMELFFSRNKDGVASGDRRGKKKTTFWGKIVNSI